MEISVAMDRGMVNRIAWTMSWSGVVWRSIFGVVTMGLGITSLADGSGSAASFGLIAMGPAFILLMPALVFLQVHRRFAQVPPGHWYYRIDTVQIAGTNPLGSFVRPWSMVRKVRRVRGLWVVMVTPGKSFLWLPEDCFTPDQSAMFRDLLTQRGLYGPR